VVEGRATSGPHIRAGTPPNGAEVIARRTRDRRDTGPSGAVVMGDRPEIAHSPDVGCRGGPDADERMGRPARDSRPASAVVMENLRGKSRRIVAYRPDVGGGCTPHAPENLACAGQRRCDARPGCAVVMDEGLVTHRPYI